MASNKIISTCVYLIRDSYWLMLLRNKKKEDLNQGKWIGIGGKKEKDETIEQCAYREVYEETGYQLEDLSLKGEVLFHQKGIDDERIYVYSSKKWHGTVHDNPEGTMKWIAEDQIMHLNLWEGDRIFLKRMLNHSDSIFHLEFTYDDQGNLIEEGETCQNH